MDSCLSQVYLCEREPQIASSRIWIHVTKYISNDYNYSVTHFHLHKLFNENNFKISYFPQTICVILFTIALKEQTGNPNTRYNWKNTEDVH